MNPGNVTASIAWPAPSPGFVLNSATDLRSGAWVPVTNSVITSNGVNIVTVPAPATRFFRLSMSTGVPQVDAVSVTVMDANGMTATAVQVVPVLSEPIPAKLNGPVTYGCESPYDPGGYDTSRIYWETAMAEPGGFGGVEGFCWTEYNSWPGDYVVPAKPGSLPAEPWIYGDADYANWGLDTANIVLYNGDGDPTGRFFAEMDPNATADKYPASYLYHPSTSAEEEFFYLNPSIHYVDYVGAWGAIGKNHNLDWLCMYACNTLTNTGNIQVGAPPWSRWGPAFNGLHAMTGFFTTASDFGFTLCADFPAAMLGLNNSAPETIAGAWIDAAFYDDVGVPAVMGPIGPEGVSDYWDFYWGKGLGVGPSIPNNLIMGWWYIVGDTTQFIN